MLWLFVPYIIDKDNQLLALHHLFAALALLLALPQALFASVPSRMGCGVPPPDPWFTDTVTIERAELAPGVTLQPATTNPQRLELRNTSATPLYLLRPQGRISPEPQPDPSLHLPSPFITDVQIVNNTVLVLQDDMHWVPVTQATPGKWWSSGEGEHTLTLYGLSVFVPGFDKPIPSEADRPVNIAVPPSEQFVITIVRQSSTAATDHYPSVQTQPYV